MREVLGKISSEVVANKAGDVLSPLGIGKQTIVSEDELDGDLEKVEKLKKFLKEMAEDSATTLISSNCDDYLKRLEDIYSNNFRHSYSQITSWLIITFEDNSVAFEVIAENIKRIYERIQNEKNLSNLSSKIFKLYDHISLEKVRMSYVSYRHNNIDHRTKELEDKIKEAEDSQKEIIKEQKDAQRNYITILGIFASIILAFVTQIVFANYAFREAMRVDWLDKFILLTLAGFFIGNCLIFLFNFIREIHYNGKVHKDKWYNSPSLLFNLGTALIVVALFLFKYFYLNL